MLDASLSSGHSLLDGDGPWKMTRNYQILALRLLGDAEVGLRRCRIVNLDEIDPALLQLPHGISPVVGGSDREPERPFGRPIVEDWTRGNDSGTKQLTRRSTLSQRNDELHVGAHIARPGNPRRDVERKRRFAGQLVMRMHVPEAGIRICRDRRDSRAPSGATPFDAIEAMVPSRMVTVRLGHRPPVNRVDYRDAHDRERLARFRAVTPTACRQMRTTAARGTLHSLGMLHTSTRRSTDLTGPWKNRGKADSLPLTARPPFQAAL